MIELRDYQTESVDFLLPKTRGFIKAPAGSGKTIIAATAAARRAWSGARVTWLANTREQVEQGIAAIQHTPGPAGVEFEVCCVAAEPDTSQADIIILDEAHHSPADTWYRLIQRAKPGAIIWGFSATPFGADSERNKLLREIFVDFLEIDRARVVASGHLENGKVYMHDLDLEGEFDPALNAAVAIETANRLRRFPVLLDLPAYHKINSLLKATVNQLIALRGKDWVKSASLNRIPENEIPDDLKAMIEKARQLTVRRVEVVREEHERRVKWQLTQEHLQAHPGRNSTAVGLALKEMSAGHSVLMLVHSVEHGESFVERIPGSKMVHSKLGAKLRRATIDDFRSGTLRTLVATSLADEGLDVPRASRLILVAGGRSATKLEQRAGRVLRPFEGKEGGVIHDFMDRGAMFALAQANARVKTYCRLGYDPEVVAYRGQAAA